MNGRLPDTLATNVTTAVRAHASCTALTCGATIFYFPAPSTSVHLRGRLVSCNNRIQRITHPSQKQSATYRAAASDVAFPGKTQKEWIRGITHAYPATKKKSCKLE